MCKQIDRLIENDIPVPTYNIEQILHQILYGKHCADRVSTSTLSETSNVSNIFS